MVNVLVLILDLQIDFWWHSQSGQRAYQIDEHKKPISAVSSTDELNVFGTDAEIRHEFQRCQILPRVSESEINRQAVSASMRQFPEHVSQTLVV